MSKRMKRPSPAMIVAVAALLLAVAGTAIGAEVYQDSGGPLGLSPPYGASLQVTWQAPG